MCAVKVSLGWQAVYYQAIQARIKKNPDNLVYAERLYDNALGNRDSLQIKRKTDNVTDDIENFRAKLREYRVALMACISYCELLKDQMDQDIGSLDSALKCDKFDGDKTPEDTEKKREAVHLSMTVLVQQRAILEKIQSECNNHLTIINGSSDALKVSLEQSDTGRLELIYLELMGLGTYKPKI